MEEKFEWRINSFRKEVAKTASKIYKKIDKNFPKTVRGEMSDECLVSMLLSTWGLFYEDMEDLLHTYYSSYIFYNEESYTEELRGIFREAFLGFTPESAQIAIFHKEWECPMMAYLREREKVMELYLVLNADKAELSGVIRELQAGNLEKVAQIDELYKHTQALYHGYRNDPCAVLGGCVKEGWADLGRDISGCDVYILNVHNVELEGFKEGENQIRRLDAMRKLSGDFKLSQRMPILLLWTAQVYPR